jgi:non-specific protein-tyrosine kinase
MDCENEDQNNSENLQEYAQILWHWAWLLLLSALLAGLAAFFISNQQARVYQSSTLIMVVSPSGSSYDSTSSLSAGQQLALTYSNTILTGPILDSVSKKLGYVVSKEDITITPVANTSLIKISVIARDAQRASLIANTLVGAFSDQVLTDQSLRYSELEKSLEDQLATVNGQIDETQQKLSVLKTSSDNASASTLLSISQFESQLTQYQQSRNIIVQSYQNVKFAEAQSTSSIIQKDPAVENKIPVQPRPLRTALLAGIVSLLLVAGIVFLIEYLGDSIRDPDEITRKWGVPILGIIVNYQSTPNTLITISQPRSPISESYRSIRTNIQFAGVNQAVKNILVTSASPEDGKTTFVANLANVIAQSERDVLVIDGDLRRPRIHKVFKLSNRLGLSDYFIRSQDQLNGMIKPTDLKRLSVITSGSIPPNPSELLSSGKMMEVLNILGKQFNIIIIDSPPLLAVTDALVLAPKMDGVILVIDPKKTKRAALKHSIDQLRKVNTNLLGVVLNNVKVKQSPYYYNRKYYYGKQYGKYSDEQVDAD